MASFSSSSVFHLKALRNLALFFVSISSVSSLTFNFNGFDPNDRNITYERSAYAENNEIYLARNVNASIGRATYAHPLQLWDNSTRNLTDFSTHFSFSIDSRGRLAYGDGLAFFLAPAGSRIPPNTTRGGSLGLTSNTYRFNTTANHFVAVEFDVYSNANDPENDHVGIDVNSMQSVVNSTWLSNVRGGAKTDAWIRYDSSSRNLSVVFTGFLNNQTVFQGIYYIIDLREFLPEFVTFGFSAASGNRSALHTIHSWSFTTSLDINPTDQSVETPRNGGSGFGSRTRRRKNMKGVVIGSVLGGCTLVLVVAFVLFVFLRNRETEDDFGFDIDPNDEFERGTGPKKFTYSELARATSKFASNQKLGEGGFGGVYKGYLRESDTYVAVKRVSSGSRQGVKEYTSEVRIISRLRHRNLVQLIGWCHEKRELLLVYEFMPNGSLDSHLFKARSSLTWETRFNVARGLASALLYLHEEWEQCVVHRDIKSSNIMLDANFNAKLGDFGLARLVDHDKGSQTTVLAGTMGYMAPECVITGKASKEGDVYSFGMVMLEIACGRKPIDLKVPEDQINIVDWVWSHYGLGNLLGASDPSLNGEVNDEEIKCLMIVGLWCAHPDSNLRPTIRQAIHVLNFEASLPILPSSMPVPTYTNTPMPSYISNNLNTVSSNFTAASGNSSNSNADSANSLNFAAASVHSSSFAAAAANSSSFSAASAKSSPSQPFLFTQ